MSSYIAQTLKTLTLFEVVWGMSKSMIFAALIAATSAVVSSIFLIILCDSFFAVARSFLR